MNVPFVNDGYCKLLAKILFRPLSAMESICKQNILPQKIQKIRYFMSLVDSNFNSKKFKS